MKTCETCRFWQKWRGDPPTEQTDEAVKDYLHSVDMLSECRIRSNGHFPHRRPDDWCGEWESYGEWKAGAQ